MKAHKLALITEAGNGLAHTFASLLKSKGFDVIIAAKGNSYKELQKRNPEHIKILELDMTKEQDIWLLNEHIKKSHGKLDVLVNNAEIANGFGQKINELDVNEMRTLYEENFFSVINLIQSMYPLLLKSEHPKVVNMSSALGDITKMKDETFCYSNYKMIGYATAKSALEMLTLLLKKEFQSTPIKISSFDPIRLKNATHNSVAICKEVIREFLDLVKSENLVKT